MLKTMATYFGLVIALLVGLVVIVVFANGCFFNTPIEFGSATKLKLTCLLNLKATNGQGRNLEYKIYSWINNPSVGEKYALWVDGYKVDYEIDSTNRKATEFMYGGLLGDAKEETFDAVISPTRIQLTKRIERPSPTGKELVDGERYAIELSTGRYYSVWLHTDGSIRDLKDGEPFAGYIGWCRSINTNGSRHWLW